MRTFHSYVDGDLLESPEVVHIVNPATEEPCGAYSSYTADMLDRALHAADEAFKTWSRTPLAERIAWMKKLSVALEARREEIIALLVAETGKPQSNAEYDYGMLPTCVEFFASEVQRLRGETIPDASGQYTHELVRHPVGVVVGLLAWNFPLLNLGYKLGPVLASGCTCILKPSSTTPLATALVGEVLREISFPRGVVNIVLGSDREVAKRLLTSPIPAMVTMIGSTEAGCELIRNSATRIKRYSLELGGNAPVIVYDDFDPCLAAERTVGLKLANSGQVCVSPNRCFVHRSVIDSFCDRAVSLMQSYRYGSGPGPEPRIGPMMTGRHLEGVLAKVQAARAQGARVLTGGGRPPKEQCPRGFYMQPTLVLCDRTIDLCREEIFGPVLPVIPFDDGDDIIAWANDCPYGLASYVFTNDLRRAQACSERLEYGSICINEPYYSVELPHGGLKQSGIGKDCSYLSLEEYFTVKRVITRKS